MKKIFGLLAVCALVACNDSSENVAGPQQWGNQNGQQQGQLNQASSSAALPASSAAVPASSAAVPKSSAATPKSSAVVVEDDGKIHMTTAWDGTEPHVPVGNNDGGWWYDYNDMLSASANSSVWILTTSRTLQLSIPI